MIFLSEYQNRRTTFTNNILDFSLSEKGGHHPRLAVSQGGAAWTVFELQKSIVYVWKADEEKIDLR